MGSFNNTDHIHVLQHAEYQTGEWFSGVSIAFHRGGAVLTIR